MRIRIRVISTKPVWKAILAGTLSLFIVCGAVVAYYYFQFARIVDERLSERLFATATQIYAAPQQVQVGQPLTVQAVAQQLRRAEFSEEGESKTSPVGTFQVRGDSVTVRPGPQSYHTRESATISFSQGRVSQIALESGQRVEAYELEPLLITPLAEDSFRGKRRLVKYEELPPQLVNAVLAIEDKRFFSHHGVDFIRVPGAIRNDFRYGYLREGFSTITMQLARGFFLSPEKAVKRKLIEIMIAFRLEERLSKQQIFEMYANQINLGQWGSFSINGFGEAAQCYFGKDVRQLNLAEAALLAGIIQHPNRISPFRHPEEARQRRNLVLDSMVKTGAITAEQSAQAKAEPLRVAWNSINAGEAPYFTDLVREQLARQYGEDGFNEEGLRIYTSLDADLQREAIEAVASGMKLVDVEVERTQARRGRRAASSTAQHPQVALVALDPHTGRVLALVGGRDYGAGQFNHAIAKRPTGSIFKPFVYAAAFNTSLSGKPLPGTQGVFTSSTLLNDERGTFEGGYSPRNFNNRYNGLIPARYALAHSLNNATVELAQMVGFDEVANIARSAGVKSARGTPSVALGAYDASPLQMASAYTVFANGGNKAEPLLVTSIRTAQGDVVANYTPASAAVLDPRVSYLTVSLMENVINSGTGSVVRQHGFLAAAAGKTGTSHDAWFAGFTSNLLCVIWIGNDDYSDINLAGGVVAAPIWAEFMKRAVKLPRYADTESFTPPDGVVRIWLDKDTGLPVPHEETQGYWAAFLDGTQPAADR